MENDNDTAQTILDATPTEVYRVLRGYDRDLYVDTGNGCNCPLHHYFCDALLMEPDDVLVQMTEVQLGYRGEGEFWHPLPPWMIDYQEAITGKQWQTTLGGCLDVLATMYPEVKAVEEEEEEQEEDDFDVEAEIREVVDVSAILGEDLFNKRANKALLTRVIGLLERYGDDLEYQKERNG